MHTQPLRRTHTSTAERKRADKAGRLRRNEIRLLVEHCFGRVPPAHITAGLLEVLGCWTNVRTVERDYLALGLTPA
jgi:hypothetical protein